MAYNQFTLAQLEQNFGIQLLRYTGLFRDVPPASISARLRESLAEDTELAVEIGTEKARSEYIIAPILAEVRRQKHKQVSLFSGSEFNVDVARGLSGFCDFLLSLSPMSLEIRAPVVSIVEAKKENILAGIPQCLAELVAAQIFNSRAEHPIDTLYGVVTSGTEWKFLRLQGTAAAIDSDLYYLDNVEKIVGVLLVMLTQDPA